MWNPSYEHHQNWSNFDTVDHRTRTMSLINLLELESLDKGESYAIPFLIEHLGVREILQNHNAGLPMVRSRTD